MKKLSNRSLILGGAISLYLSTQRKNWFIGMHGARQLATTIPPKGLSRSRLPLKDYKHWLTVLNKKYWWDYDNLTKSAQELRAAHERALKALL